MKSKVLKLLVPLLSCVFVSCSSPELREENNTLYGVSFYLQPSFDIRSFPKTKSMPGNLPSEPHTKQADGTEEEPSLFDRIEYALYEKETGALVKHISLTEENSDEDFGVYLYDKVEAGIYKVALLAHSASDASFENNIISGGDVGDSFFASAEFEVGPHSQELSVELTLRRVVSRIEFFAEDVIPVAADKFIIQVSGRYDSFNLREGNATQLTPLTQVYSLNETGETAYAFYTFVPTSASETDTYSIDEIQLTTLDNSGDTLYSVTVQNTPIIRNHIIRYTGDLYTRKISNALKLQIEDNGLWKDPIDLQLP